MSKTICPDEEMLVNYLEGRLSDNERTGVEEHLSDCDACLEELIIVGHLERTEKDGLSDPVPDGVTRAAVDMISWQSRVSPDLILEKVKRSARELHDFFFDFLSPVLWRDPGLARTRGSKKEAYRDLIRLRKTFGDIEMEIEIEKQGENKALIRARLADPIGNEGIRVTLKKGGREISSALLNRGYVVFEDIPFGHYGIISSRDGVILGEYLFRLKETHYGRR